VSERERERVRERDRTKAAARSYRPVANSVNESVPAGIYVYICILQAHFTDLFGHITNGSFQTIRGGSMQGEEASLSRSTSAWKLSCYESTRKEHTAA
jgi:hypothetical protein